MRTSPRGLTPTANYSKRVAQLQKVDDHYELLTSKRRNSVYRANRRVLELKAASGARIDIEFQVSNDGFAFRYVFPETDTNDAQDQPRALVVQFPRRHARLAAAHCAGALGLERNESFLRGVLRA